MSFMNVLGLILTHKTKWFFRSTLFYQKLAGKIFSLIAVLYFTVIFLAAGYMLDEMIQKALPDDPADAVVNRYIFLFLFIMLAGRFIMQKLPRVNLLPYLHLPLTKGRLTAVYCLLSQAHIFNLIPVIIILPYWVKVVCTGYTLDKSLPWLGGFILLALGFGFLLLILKVLFFKRPVLFILPALGVLGVYYLESAGIIGFFTLFSGWIFDGLLSGLYLLFFVPVLLCAAAALTAYYIIKRSLYRDQI